MELQGKTVLNKCMAIFARVRGQRVLPFNLELGRRSAFARRRVPDGPLKAVEFVTDG